jgi:hypothetical protein
MAHTQTPDFVFRRNGRVPFKSAGGVSSVDYWQPRCAHQRYYMMYITASIAFSSSHVTANCKRISATCAYPLLDRRTPSFSMLYEHQLCHHNGRGQLKCDDTRAETRLRLSAKRTCPFKSAGDISSVDYWQPRCAHQRCYITVSIAFPLCYLISACHCKLQTHIRNMLCLSPARPKDPQLQHALWTSALSP